MEDKVVGGQIGHYRIDTMLGRGGMGAVYRAFDMNLARPVALKVMHGHLADQNRFQQRFMQEAQAIARLDHPSIVNVHDFGQDGDTLYMVMTYVEGGNLAAYIKELKRQEKSVNLNEILFLMSQVADALGYAHARGVLHRDVKPDNIMIKHLHRPERSGEPPLRAVVTDFGLAKLLEGGMHTATGTLLGTMDYISPEQCKGEQPSPRSDIYALGVMLYHLTTGQLPYEINSLTEAIIKHTSEFPPFPSEIRPEIPPPLEVVINKAMAKNPADRYENAEALASLLRRIRAALTGDQLTQFERNTVVLSIVDQLQTGQFVTPQAVTRPRVQMPTTVEAAPKPPEPAVLKVVLRPNQLNVTPGGKVTADVNVMNAGGTAATVRLLVADLPPEWVKVRQDAIYLPPGSQQSAPIVITTPLDSSAGAGQHRFRVVVAADSGGKELAGAAGTLQIAPFERFASELRPPLVKNGETAQLFVRNDGNMTTSFQVGGEDPAHIIHFESLVANLQQVEPGQIGTMDLRILTEKRPFTGRAKAVPFTLQVNGQTNYQQLNGRLEVKPRVPVMLLALLALVLCAGSVLGTFAVLNSGIFETVDAEATSEALAVAQRQTEEAQPALVEEPTPEAQEAAFAMQTVEAEGTVMAMTAEADGDDDNDGLSNLLESALGTNPSVSDSDGDGLLDGEEINQYNSSPTEADTDGDGLTDGEEIRIYRTSANNPDTDGDGMSDGDEIEAGENPLVLLTSTPTATLSPSPTVTDLPTATPTATPTPPTTGAGTGGGLPLGFESFGVWGRGDQDNGTITQSGEQSYSGGSSAKISYDFKTADNDFVVFLQFNDIAGEPTGLSIWVYGDGEGHYLNAWIIDSEGQTWQMPLGRVSHTGWAQLSGEIDTDQDWPWTHISGPDNEVVDYPIRFRGFALDDVNNDFTGQGEIYLDDLTAVIE